MASGDQMSRGEFLERAARWGFGLLLGPAAGQRSATIALQPLDGFDPRLIDIASAAISEIYGVKSITVLPFKPLPQSARRAPGGRYRAEKLLEHLEGWRSGYSRIVGLTDVDISTTKGSSVDWGIFGMANRKGTACVASTFRLSQAGTDKALFEARFRKVVIHEVGHTFNLAHCAVPGCVMQDARGTIRTFDQSGGGLCSWCRRHLRFWPDG
jgi:archaemetzincin